MDFEGSLKTSHEADAVGDGIMVVNLDSFAPIPGNRTGLKLAADGHV
jgi:hypothetical protein